MIKLLLRCWLFSLPSGDGRFRAHSACHKIWFLLKKRYRVLKMKYRTLKILRRRRNARKIREKTDRWVRYLVVSLFLILLLFPLAQCNGVKHIIEITEPLDHTEGDDGGKLKYKIIFGDKSQKE